MLLLKCPKCGNQMRCDPKPGVLKGKRKRCVYCGKNFAIMGNALKQF